MTYIIIIIILVIIILILSKKRTKEVVVYKEKEKEGRKEKILGALRQAQGKKITNNDVEKLLGVSDATATNYLQELEDEGKIKQIGRTGKGVYYISNG